MDPEAFLDLANQVTKLKMFPYFDIAHCLLCALSVREDLASGNLIFKLLSAFCHSTFTLKFNETFSRGRALYIIYVIHNIQWILTN